MYFQITTSCNMSCAHCCMSCAANKRGSRMSRETFINALRIAADYDEYITLGGGEPTMHRDLFPFIHKALDTGLSGVLVITNGKKTASAFKLLEIAEYDERFSTELSQDQFHDPIDPVVVRAFRNRNAIRTVKRILPHGNALVNQLNTEEESDPCTCCCAGTFIKPNGDVKLCGCADAPTLGNCNDPAFAEQFNRYVGATCDLGSSSYECWKYTREQVEFGISDQEDPTEYQFLLDLLGIDLEEIEKIPCVEL